MGKGRKRGEEEGAEKRMEGERGNKSGERGLKWGHFLKKRFLRLLILS